MKKILILLFSALAFTTVSAQPGFVPYRSNVKYIGLAADSSFYIPIRDTNFTPARLGSLTIRPQDSLIYIGIKITAGGKRWDKLSNWIGAVPGGGGSGITQLGNSPFGLIRLNDSTYLLDSMKVITKYQSEKSRDSLGALIAGKSDTSSVINRNGNSGLNPGSYYIGTRDSVPLIFKISDTTMAGFVGVKSLWYPEASYREYLDDVSLGAGALQRKLTDFPTSAKGIVAIGPGALRKFNGTAGAGALVAIGRGAMRDDILSYRSVHIGEYNGYMGPGGDHNTSVGAFGMEVNRRGGYNSAYGSNAMRSNKLGSFNNAFGFFSLLQNTTVIDTILVTEGGSGYTTAPTVVISAPDPATAGSLSIQATATAVLNGDTVQYILMTNKGAGYGGEYQQTPVTVTFSGGGGSGATAVPVYSSGEYNNAFGYAAGAFNRAGKHGIYIGTEAGMGLSNASPSYFDDDVIFIGRGASRATYVPWNNRLLRSAAIGYNAKVGKDSTIAIGASGMRGVVIHGDTVYRRYGLSPVLDVRGGAKISYIFNDEGAGYANYFNPSLSWRGYPSSSIMIGHGRTDNWTGDVEFSALNGQVFISAGNLVGARDLVIQNYYGGKPIIFKQVLERMRIAFNTGNVLIGTASDTTDNGRKLQVKGTIHTTDTIFAKTMSAADSSDAAATTAYVKQNLASLPAGAGIDSVKFNPTTSTLTIYAGGNSYPAYINPSYLTFDSTKTPLGGMKNDSTGIQKSVEIKINGVTVTPTVTDSTIIWDLTVTGGGSVLIGAFNTYPGNTSGATVSGDTLYFHVFSSENPGMVPAGSTETDVLKGSGWTTSFDDRDATIRKWIATGTGVNPNTFGWGSNRVSAGTTSTQAPATTSFLTKFPRVRMTSSTATSQVIGERYGNTHFFGTHGFEWVSTFGVPDTCASWRFAAGMFNTTGAHSFAEPSTFTNGVFIGKNSTDPDFQIMHNDGAGSCTKIATGIYADQTAFYKVRVYTNGGSSYTVTLTNMSSGVSFTSTVSTNIPGSTTGMGPQISMQNNTSGADDVALDISRQIIITQF